ncbi:MAG: thioredoxin family protein [Comamonadaceae bacterium]|nr:thioredoxin family protein [Comamonadaceae bacterium]
MLVLYSQADCPWCERARREYLVPMQRDAAYRDRVVLRQIDIDSDTPLTDFAGRPTTHREFGKAERARVAPTVMIYGPGGERLSDPIVGFRIPDFYGAYLERAIDEGLARYAAAQNDSGSPPPRRTKRICRCGRTSACSAASSATPCATRRARPCSTWSSASARPPSAIHRDEDTRRTAPSSRPPSTV